MPKVAKELSQSQADAIKETGLHAVGGVSGLHVQISGQYGRSWILRTVTSSGHRRDFGLGSCSDVSLSKARDYAKKLKHIYACQKIESKIGKAEETTFCPDGTIHPLLVETPLFVSPFWR